MSNIRLIANRKYPSIPTVGGDASSHTMVLEAMRDAIQTHERRGRDPLNSFLRLYELVGLGLVRREGDELVLTFDPANTGGGGTSALADLTDVDLAGLSDGDILRYDSVYGIWMPEAPSVGGSAAIGAGPDDIPSSPDAMDDEFEAGSLDAKWSWRNQGTSTVAFGQGALRLIAELNAAGANQRIIEQPVPGGTWKFRARMATFIGATGYGGLCVTDNATGKQILLHVQVGNIYMLRMNSVTSTNAIVSSNYDASLHGGLAQWRYYEIEYNGTNIIVRHSQTGVEGSFTLVGTDPAASFLGTPTHIGIYNHSGSTTVPSETVCDWFRRMA